LLLPALGLGLLLSRDLPWVHLLAMLLMVGLFGRAFTNFHLLQVWRRAKANALALELPGRDYLFADSHAVLRYTLLTSAQQFARGVVGAAFWYILGGMPLMFGYLVLSEVAGQARSAIYGWAAIALFRLVDAIPRVLSMVLLAVSGLFVRGIHPIKSIKARDFQSFISYLLDVSLGGRMPERDVPWTGTGTPKVMPVHVLRWLLLRVAATVLLLFLLGAQDVAKLLSITL